MSVRRSAFAPPSVAASQRFVDAESHPEAGELDRVRHRLAPGRTRVAVGRDGQGDAGIAQHRGVRPALAAGVERRDRHEHADHAGRRERCRRRLRVTWSRWSALAQPSSAASCAAPVWLSCSACIRVPRPARAAASRIWRASSTVKAPSSQNTSHHWRRAATASGRGSR